MLQKNPILETETFRKTPNLGNLLVLLEKNLDPHITENILNIYQVGSRVYQCHNENSDWDFICVLKNPFLPYHFSVG